MKPIAPAAQCYRVEGKPIHLTSGEFHYFRVPRRDWETRMKLFQDAGGNCLATYVPWLLHEPEEGTFTFDCADGHLNVEEFFETAGKVGLYVLARPGPYQYSELVYAGLPRWLGRRYPDLLAQRADGSVLGPDSVSYTHPLFLTRVRTWFGQVALRIARHTISRGGPVAFTQLDNEAVGIQWWKGSLDYNAQTFGFGRADGPYAEFLRRRYGEVGALAAAYELPIKRWEEAHPVAGAEGSAGPRLRRQRDYLDMYLAELGRYFVTLARWLRDAGVDTPLVHNSGNPGMNALFNAPKAALESAGEALVVGSDHYYTLDQTWGQNNPTPQYAVRCFESLEALRLMGCPPTVFEIPGGSLSNWPPIGPVDAEAAYRVNLAFGMKGHNLYIYTGGPNPAGAGTTSDVYDYDAAVGPFGEVRPLHAVHERFGRMLAKHSWLAEAQAQTDFRVAAAPQDGLWEYYGRGTVLPVTPEQGRHFLLTGVLSTALCAGLSPQLCSLDDDGWLADVSPPVVVCASSIMGRRQQGRVVDHLKGGGRALILPLLPTLDERFHPCTELADFLGMSTAAMPRDGARASVAGVDNVYINGGLFELARLPAGAEVLGRDATLGKVIAARVDVKGGGMAVVLGMWWLQAMREHERMLRGLLERLGLKAVLRASNPNVWCTLRTAGGRSMLFVMNLFVSPQKVQVECRPGWSGNSTRWEGEIPGMTVRMVELAEGKAPVLVE